MTDNNSKGFGVKRLSALLPGLKALKWIRAWKNTAGPALLKQAQFVGLPLVNGKKALHLAVADPLWRGELEYQKFDILSRYNGELLREGIPAEEHPQTCLLTASTAMPVQSTYSQKGRDKVRIKR